MNDAQSALYTVALVIGVFSVAVMRGQQGKAATANLRWVNLYLGLVTMGGALEWAMVHPSTPFKAVWLGLHMATSLLIGPILWLAVREVVRAQRPVLRDLASGYFARIGVGLLCIEPLFSAAHGATDYAGG
jgi:hypothetical protein